MGRHWKVIAELLCGCLLLAVITCSCSRTSELARVKAAAKRGVPEAQYQLGAYYHDGVEIAPDYKAAAMWLRRAAEQGHPAAQFALGEMYLNAEGMLPDEAEAAQWIRRAAGQGYAPAQDELSVMYAEGIGVTQDDAEAVSWATKAAEQGFPDAQYHLGRFLSSKAPDSASPDNVAACMWLTLAAASGHKESEELLETLKSRLSAAQIQEVKRRTEQWKRAHPNPE